MQVGVDAYASVAEVSAYLVSRGIDSAWTGATTPKKEAAIIEATSFLDAAFSWTGAIEETTQTLGWPRYDAYDREGRPLDDIPTAVKNACAELANLALGGRLMPMALATGGSGIRRERIGDVEVEYDSSIYTASYDYVMMMLRGIGAMRSTSSGISKLVRA